MMVMMMVAIPFGSCSFVCLFKHWFYILILRTGSLCNSGWLQTQDLPEILSLPCAGITGMHHHARFCFLKKVIGWACSSVIACLSSMHEALSWNPSITKKNTHFTLKGSLLYLCKKTSTNQ
jgi:hypothetical protein